MNFHFWSYMLGAATLLLIQWVSMIPFYRRHRVITALIDRAKMYQQRGKMFADAGFDEAALSAWQECRTLLAQVEELQKGNKV